MIQNQGLLSHIEAAEACHNEQCSAISARSHDTHSRRRKTRTRTRTRRSAIVAISAVTLACNMNMNMNGVHGFTGVSPADKHFAKQRMCPPNNIRRGGMLNMYVKSNAPTSQTAPMVAKAIFSSHQSNRRQANKRKNAASPLSNSVLSSSDTLPSFPTAHGLLSPETVLRMEEMTSSGSRDAAVEYFLKTYRNQGPMACLPLLSDANVLPRLTEAMRDVIA